MENRSVEGGINPEDEQLIQKFDAIMSELRPIAQRVSDTEAFGTAELGQMQIMSQAALEVINKMSDAERNKRADYVHNLSLIFGSCGFVMEQFVSDGQINAGNDKKLFESARRGILGDIREFLEIKG